MGRILAALSLTATFLPTPAAFADQVYSFQIADYPASQGGGEYDVGGIIEWDATSNTQLAAGSISLAPSGSAPLDSPLSAFGHTGATLPLYTLVAGGVVDLLLPVGSNVFVQGRIGTTGNFTIQWFNQSFGGTTSLLQAEESTPSSFQTFYSNSPAPLDAFGLPANAPWIIATTPLPVLPGDVNLDGIVNAQDLALVASSWMATGANVADVNGDGVVNSQDLAVVSSNWGAMTGFGASAPAPVPVPEPSALILAALGGLALLAWRRIR